MDPFYYDDSQPFFDQYPPQFDPYFNTYWQKNIKKPMQLNETIDLACKTIRTINQIIPFIYQITPVVINLRNAFKIMQSIQRVNEIDDQEIDDAIIVEKDHDKDNEKPELMV